MFGLYIGIFQLVYLSEPEETPVVVEEKEEPAPLIEEAKLDEIITPETEEIDPDAEVSVHATMEKAIENYKRIKEGKTELTEKEQDQLDKECEAIRQRQIIDVDEQHDAVELSAEGKILMGPPTLTRFEKARIMGARALQLSLGAPPFIDIPVSAATSLDISMKELEERVIPITIRRVLPNGDYQNIPLFDFKE
jgi:DNA-directed RNA polymerase I, II, and III subunit RPABC2